MSVFHSVLFRQQALIAGSWRDAADGTTLAVSNPSTGATLGQIPQYGACGSATGSGCRRGRAAGLARVHRRSARRAIEKLAPPDPRKQNRAGADR